MFKQIPYVISGNASTAPVENIDPTTGGTDSVEPSIGSSAVNEVQIELPSDPNVPIIPTFTIVDDCSEMDIDSETIPADEDIVLFDVITPIATTTVPTSTKVLFLEILPLLLMTLLKLLMEHPLVLKEVI